MRVSGLTKAGDWRFGKGKAVYLSRSKAIAQNVVTRLRAFTDDWFLDVTNGVTWFELLGSRGNEARVLRAIERTVLQTDGVIRLDRLEIISRDKNRQISIALEYTDVFGERFINNSLELP